MAKGKGNKKDALEKALDRAVQDASEEKAREEEAARFAEEVRDDDLDLENVEIHKDMDSADVTAVDGDYGANQIQILEGLEAEGEEPVLLLWAVAEDIRTLIRLTAALKQGQSVQSVRNSLRLWGDKQTLAPIAVKRIPAVRLIEALKTCAKIDRIIKGAEDGDAWTEFKQLVTGLAV